MYCLPKMQPKSTNIAMIKTFSIIIAAHVLVCTKDIIFLPNFAGKGVCLQQSKLKLVQDWIATNTMTYCQPTANHQNQTYLLNTPNPLSYRQSQNDQPITTKTGVINMREKCRNFLQNF